MGGKLGNLLKRRRLALLAFGAAEAREIIDAAEDAGSLAREVASVQPLPGLNPLIQYDVCVVNAGAALGADAASPLELATAARRPVVVVCDEAELENREVACVNGARDFAVRPLRTPELLLRVATLAQNFEQQDRIPRSSDPHRRVLVVDDDDAVVTLIKIVLKHAGFACDLAHSGSEALELSGKSHYDAILLDRAMPGMDGLSTLAALRAAPQTRNVAVILVTSSSAEEDVVRGLSLGANDYVTKPFHPGELTARVARAIRDSVSRNGR